VKYRTAAGVGFQLVATHVRHLRGTEVIVAAAALIATAVVWAAGGAVRDHIYEVNENNYKKATDRPTNRLTDRPTD
jgi:hypothetical protein